MSIHFATLTHVFDKNIALAHA